MAMTNELFESLAQLARDWQRDNCKGRKLRVAFILDGARVVSMGTNKSPRPTDRKGRRVAGQVDMELSSYSEIDAVMRLYPTEQFPNLAGKDLYTLFSYLDLVSIWLDEKGCMERANLPGRLYCIISSMGFRSMWRTQNDVRLHSHKFGTVYATEYYSQLNKRTKE